MTVLGLGPLLANLSRIQGQIMVAKEEGLNEAGDTIRDAWVGNIESEGLILTGAYRDSIRVDNDGPWTAVYTDVEYAGILEYGDSRQAAHPVAERAFDEHHDKALDVVGNRIRAATR